MKKSLFILLVINTLLGCKSSFHSYKEEEGKRYAVENLSEEEFASVKQYLKKYSAGPLKDTIVIKYDFNNDHCWQMLDTKNDEYINSVLNTHQKYWAKYRDSVTSVSAFEFRDPGKNFSKLVKWNSDINIDSSRLLYKLLIKERAMCGISVMILPDKRVIKTRSDPHYEVLDYNAEKLTQMLESGNAVRKQSR